MRLWKGKIFRRFELQGNKRRFDWFFEAHFVRVFGQREIEAFDGLEIGPTPNSATFRSTIIRARNSGNFAHPKRFTLGFPTILASRRGQD
jgi:hypothetical protein